MSQINKFCFFQGILIAITVSSLPASANAQWHVASQTKTLALDHGASFVQKNIAGPADAELKLVFFDVKQCELRIAVQASREKALSLADAMRSTEAIAGCNGAYFTPEFLPLGLEISR